MTFAWVTAMDQMASDCIVLHVQKNATAGSVGGNVRKLLKKRNNEKSGHFHVAVVRGTKPSV